MKQVKIYTLSSSKEPENIRYIGQTGSELKYRLSRHIQNSKSEKTHKSYWINKELKNGNKILIKEIYIVPENENWEKWEVHFISEYKKLGYKLTNSTIGGEGLCGEDNPFFGKKHKKITIQKNKENQPYKRSVDKYDLKGNLIKTYQSISEAAFDVNLKNTMISDVCRHRPKHKTSGGFVWRFKGEPFFLEYLNPAEQLRKIVCQYSKDGKLIKEFDSMSEAAKLMKVSSGNISRCCNQEIKSVGGYIWRFKGDKFSYENKRSDAKPIIQLTESGAYICEFKSISEASEVTGVYYTGIYFCCTGKYKNSGGFKWKFKD